MCQDFHACQGCTWNVCKNRGELEVGLGLCKYVHACVCVCEGVVCVLRSLTDQRSNILIRMDASTPTLSLIWLCCPTVLMCDTQSNKTLDEKI